MPPAGLIELDELARRLLTPSAARVIAVDGPSGSGKSTFARQLAARLPGSAIVQIDDFLSWDDLTGVGWWDRFENQVLLPAWLGLSLRYQVRDWEHDEFGSSLSAWKSVEAGSFVIIEGVTSARRAARPRLAFSVWVEAPRDLRLERGLLRDGLEHRDRWLAWMAIEDAFFSHDQTKASVDLLVDGSAAAPHDPLTQAVLL